MPMFLTDEAPPACTRVWRDEINKRPVPDALLVNVDDWDQYYRWLMRNDPRGPMTHGVTRGILFRGIDVIDDPGVPAGTCQRIGAVTQFVRHGL